MEMRTGYKQSEVGVIPTDWQTSKTGKVCGFIVPGRNKPKLFDGDIPWITTPDLEEGMVVSISRLGLCVSRAEAKAVGSKVVPVGSVLMSCAGELGIVAEVEKEIVVNQQLHVFIPTDRIDGKFLLNALSYRKEQIAGYGTKTAVPYLNKSACNSIPVPLPPLPEQRAIAGALGDVDALLGGLERLLAKKRDLKQAALQQLLTGQTRLPGFSGIGYKQSEVGLIPADWDNQSLGSVCDVRDGTHESPLFFKDGVPFITSKNIVDGRLNLENVSYISASDAIDFDRRSKVTRGDILMSMIGTIGNAVLVDCEPNFCIKNVALVKPRYVEPGFLLQLINSLVFQRYLADNLDGGIQKFISLGTLRQLSIPLPDKLEQTAIAAVLSDLDAEITALEARRDKTRDLKQAMMQELLTGRIRLL